METVRLSVCAPSLSSVRRFLIFLLLQLTTKVEIHRGGKWAKKNVLVSYSDDTLGRLTDEGGGDEEAEMNSQSLVLSRRGLGLDLKEDLDSNQGYCSDTRPQR